MRGLSGTFDIPRVRSPAVGMGRLALEGASVAGVALDSVTVGARFRGNDTVAVAIAGTMPTGPHGAALAQIHSSGDTLALTLDSLAVYTHNNAWHLAAPAHFQSRRGRTRPRQFHDAWCSDWAHEREGDAAMAGRGDGRAPG